MNKEEFIEKLEDILQTEESLKEETVLEDLEEWDSLAKMSLAAFYSSQFSKSLTFQDFKSLKTVKDLIDLAGI